MIDKISPQTSMKAIHQILRPCPKFCWLINHFTDKYESHASNFKTESTLKCRNVFSNIRQIVQSLRKSLQILIYSDVHKGSIYAPLFKTNGTFSEIFSNATFNSHIRFFQTEMRACRGKFMIPVLYTRICVHCHLSTDSTNAVKN